MFSDAAGPAALQDRQAVRARAPVSRYLATKAPEGWRTPKPGGMTGILCGAVRQFSAAWECALLVIIIEKSVKDCLRLAREGRKEFLVSMTLFRLQLRLSRALCARTTAERIP